MTIIETSRNQLASSGVEKGERMARCMRDFLQKPTATTMYKSFNLAHPGELEAHDTFVSQLGLPGVSLDSISADELSHEGSPLPTDGLNTECDIVRQIIPYEIGPGTVSHWIYYLAANRSAIAIE